MICFRKFMTVWKKDERVLVTTLTRAHRRSGWTEFLTEDGVRVRYLSVANIDTVERVEIVRDLRSGTFDVLVGINLLRRRAGCSGSVAGCDSGCGQGRVLTFGTQPHPDDRTCGARSSMVPRFCMPIP